MGLTRGHLMTPGLHVTTAVAVALLPSFSAVPSAAFLAALLAKLGTAAAPGVGAPPSAAVLQLHWAMYCCEKTVSFSRVLSWVLVTVHSVSAWVLTVPLGRVFVVVGLPCLKVLTMLLCYRVLSVCSPISWGPAELVPSVLAWVFAATPGAPSSSSYSPMADVFLPRMACSPGLCFFLCL